MKAKLPQIPELFKDDPEVIAVLDPSDYWEWRTTIEEMKHHGVKAELAVTKQKLMETEIRCATLQSVVNKQTVSATIAQKEQISNDYKSYVKRLEEKYNITLNDCIIGDINYEVRKVTK